MKIERIDGDREVNQEKEIEIKIHDWSEVKSACNRMLYHFYPETIQFTDPVGEIYNDALPTLLDRIFAESFRRNMDRNIPDLVMLQEAYKQLERDGFIGAKYND